MPADKGSAQDLSTPSLIAAAAAASSAKAALTSSAVKNSQTAAPLAGEEDLGSPSEEFVLTVNENNESKMTAVNNTQQVKIYSLEQLLYNKNMFTRLDLFCVSQGSLFICIVFV